MSERYSPQDEHMRHAEIARLNDEFRRTTEWYVVTPGIQELPDIHGLFQGVRHYDDFDEANDPYSEHDFGVMNWHNERTYWKISYYDQSLEYGEDPLSEDCQRVLTVMTASEY